MNPIFKWVTVGSCLVLLVGCNLTNKSAARQPTSPAPQKVSYTQHAPQITPARTHSRNPQAVAKRMVEIASRYPEVESATAISLGKYTVVGLNVKPTLDRGRVGTLKYTVAEALKKDPQGSNALVTADLDLVQRIRELNVEIRHGRPVSGAMKELADIVERINPQFSRTVKSTKEPTGKSESGQPTPTTKPAPTSR